MKIGSRAGFNLRPEGPTKELSCAGAVVGGPCGSDVIWNKPLYTITLERPGRHRDGHVNVQGNFDVFPPGLPLTPFKNTLVSGTLGQSRQVLGTRQRRLGW